MIHFCDLLDKRIANEGNNNRDNASARLDCRNTFQNSIKSYINVMPTMQRQESAVEAACDLVSSEETNASSLSQHTNDNQSRNQYEVSTNTQISHNINEACSSSETLHERLKDSFIKTKSKLPKNNQNSECTVCFDNPINSVLYRCGHMCMCHPCAMKHWYGINGSACPICRAPIVDVIRTFKAN